MPEFRLRKRVKGLVDETSQTVDRTRHRIVAASRGAIAMPKDEAERLIEKGENLFERLVERGEQIEKAQTDRLAGWRRTWERRSHRQIEAVEEQIEQQVRAVMEALHVPGADDLERLHREIDRISQRLDDQLAQVAAASLPIEGYEDMTVKQALPLLHDLDEDQLQTVRAYEELTRNRVTILRDIDHRLEKLAQAQ